MGQPGGAPGQPGVAGGGGACNGGPGGRGGTGGASGGGAGGHSLGIAYVGDAPTQDDVTITVGTAGSGGLGGGTDIPDELKGGAGDDGVAGETLAFESE